MALTSPLPYLAIMALYLAIAYAIAKGIPFYRSECCAGGSGRYEAIDGLRGYLALGVFFTHAVLTYFWYQTGKWGGQPAGIYGETGRTAVALFFCITGFLFWGKILRNPHKMDWLRLFRSRVLRLTPLYLFSVAVVFFIVAVKTGFSLNVSPKLLITQVLTWLTFSIIEPMNINGLKSTERINAGVLWTLAYEWKFYLSLPLLAIFARGWAFILLAAAFALVYSFVPAEKIIINFLIGMLAAHLVHRNGSRQWFSTAVPAIVAIACLVSLVMPLGELRFWLEPVLLFTVFLVIAQGNSLFGLLTLPAAKYLGTVSYSLYLLHGIGLYVGLQMLHKVKPIQTLQPIEYWLAAATIGALVILFSGLTYRFVEHPFLARKDGALPRDGAVRK